jgi:hypothetical protein
MIIIMDTNIEDFSDYSAIIYKHPNIEACDVNNYKSIVATKDIKFGELLLLEHVFAAKTPICFMVIENNAKLFDSYHPRTTKHADTVNRLEQAKEKLLHNCFGLANGNNLINIYLQQINHSCTASCAVFVQENYVMEDTNIIFMELYAINKITKGSELTINYGPETSHKRDFECKCGKDLAQRQLIFNISSNLAKSLSTKNGPDIKRKIKQYLEQPLAKKILLNQYLSVNGIYINSNTISGYSQEGVTMMNDVIHKYMGLDKNEIKTTNGKVIEETMNTHKLNLFLQILNEIILTKPN